MAATSTPTKPDRNARQRVHDRIDQLLDIAEREQLWGKVFPEILIQDGRIVKHDCNATLGEKFN